ncbi:pitrilysin family protein [Sphingomonas sp. AR_OL41]|uniref:M16 family metallopeptidase n=1 Tax=Sphingomonas sp. AR_OL41 TaxID=3042729 RepID=UPI002480A709|nr:pitrilysin family protein [Sphingomonas sp. AR_OL41]MDH7973766.1 pitrilysin family protein [Sphingomonas sp. AR_OL41]
MNRKLFVQSAALLSGVALAVLAVPASGRPATPAPVTQPAASVASLVAQVAIPYQQFTLPNGLRVIVHTDRKAPIVAVSVWYNVGSKMEPAGKTGFAHLFEHLMFNGSQNAPGDYFTYLKQLGATDYNGTTYFDRTNYFETVPTPGLGAALFLEADRMGHLLPAMTQALVDEQRGVVQNEKRQGDNEPYGLVEYKQVEALFPATHPYGHTTIGSMSDLDAASLTDVKAWFTDHYGPNNAVLVLAGDIDVATARPLVEKYFGGIARGPQVHLPVAPVPTLAAPKVETITDRVATTRLYRMWAVPGLNDQESVALDVAASALGGLSSARLYQALVKKEKLAVSARASNDSFSQLGIFEITVDVKPGVDPALVNKRIDEILADFLKTGPTADEVQRIATSAAVRRIAGLESVGGFGGKAVALAQGALFSNDPDHYKKELAILAAETPARVTAAANKWLSRPVYALTVAPGARAAYAQAAAPAKAPAAAAAAAPDAPPVKLDVGKVEALSFPKVERTRLSNGIELVYAQRAAVPMTRAVISFDAGGAADPATRLGTQIFTLSMMREGTPTLDSNALGAAGERLGMAMRTGASADRTSVVLSVPSVNLGPALDIFADVTRRPTLPVAELDRVRGQLLAAIAQEKTNPNALAGRAVPPLLYGPNSPYTKLAAGTGDPAAVKTMTRDELLAFAQAWIRPDKAKIFVVSDRPLAEIKAAMQAHFGDWTATGAAGVKDFAAPPVQATPKIVLIDRPDSPQSIIIAAALTGLKGTDDLLPYSTANVVLGGDFLSRINMDLREARHWSYGAGGGFAALEFAAPYQISAPVQADKTGPAIASLQDDLKHFLTDQGITADEFDRTIAGATRQLSGSFETGNAVLGAMQTNDLLRRPDDYYQTLAARLGRFTRAELDAAARRVIDPSKLVWIVVGDANKVRPQLDSLGLPVEVVAAESVADRH